jgi:hypothetical protein
MFSLEAAQECLRDSGYVDLEDSGVGELVADMAQRSFRYWSPYGLDFCERYILKDQVRAHSGASGNFFSD